MKNLWKKIWDNRYLRLAVIGLGIIIVGLILYRLFVSSHVLFRQNEKVFLESVKGYYNYDPSKLPKKGGFSEVSLQDMYDVGRVEALHVPYKNRLCSEDSFVRVINENGEYRYVTYLKCGKYESRVDHDAPEIILNGSDTVIIAFQQEYKDLGVKEILDNQDGKIDISKVKIDTSGLDINRTGNYQVVYEVYDKNFNLARVKRNVVVAETFSSRIIREKGKDFYYSGDAIDNYVMFSGMIYRIVKIDNNGNLMLITDNTIANVSYGDASKEYPDSNIYRWLNNYFLSNISTNSQKYLVESDWCYDLLDLSSENTCNNKVSSKVGLLSLKDFQFSISNGRSYLVQNSRFYMLNKETEQTIWVSDIYNTNRLNTMHVTDLVGVRPVIIVKGDTYLTAGDGSLNSPYKLQDYMYGKENEYLNSRLIGEHVQYSGYTFRIQGIDENGNIKLIATDLISKEGIDDLYAASYDLESTSVIPSAKQEGNLYYALNHDAINYLSEKSIVEHEYSIPIFDDKLYYDELESSKVVTRVSIPASFELFASLNNMAVNNQVYWLSDYSSQNLVTVLNGTNGIAFRLGIDTFPRNNVKPVIYVKSDLKIASGMGTPLSPYYVR